MTQSKQRQYGLAASSGFCISRHGRGMVGRLPRPTSAGQSVAARRCAQRGTTLLEVAICVVIVGIAGTAVMEFMGSGTRANSVASSTITGLNLARAGREWAGTQSYATLQALCATTKVCSPAIGGQGDAMVGYTGWSQEFSARQVSATNLCQDTTAKTDTLRVTVTARHNGVAVCSLDWLVFNQAAATQPAGTP